MHLDATSSTAVPRVGWRVRLKRVGLIALMSALALNLVTGSPLVALWVGSQVQGHGPPTMGAFLTFVVVIAINSFVLVKVISAVGRAHDNLIARRPTVRAHLPWLRSLRGERPAEMGAKSGLSALDVILVIVVLLAILAFEVWFFLYAGSPIDQRSGRE